MKVTRVEHGLVLARNKEGFVRSPGLHMSDLYGSYFKLIQPKRYDKKDANGDPEEMDEVIMEEGMAFEDWLEPTLRKRLGGDRPGEFFTQHSEACSLHGSPVRNGAVICHCGAGVAYSPDWIFDAEWVLGEFKRTKYSLREAPYHEKFDKWVCQMMVYCYHLKMLEAWLFVLFINGDYSFKSPDGDEQIVKWVFEWTQPELDRNWNKLVRHGRKVGLIPNV